MKIKSFMRLKLSDRLQRALDDLKKVEKDKKFRVNMGLWAANVKDIQYDENGDEIITETPPKKYCTVCHAGSVLAKSINGPLFKKLLEEGNGYEIGCGMLEEAGEDSELAERFEDFLRGVNYLRECMLDSAADAFGLNDPNDEDGDSFFDSFKYRDRHVSYDNDPTGYKKWFQLVINYVKRKGK